MFKRNTSSKERGFFMCACVLCCSNEKNLNHISCNVPRLNVICLTLKKHMLRKRNQRVFYAKEWDFEIRFREQCGWGIFKMNYTLATYTENFDRDSPLSFSNTWDFTLSLSNSSFLLRIF